MAEDLVVSVKGAVPAVIARWTELSESQIAKLADEAWYADPMDEGQADLLFSLSLCKRITGRETADELLALWHKIEDSHHQEGKGYGGIIYAEGHKNYRAARKFIEGSFVPELLRALEQRFNELATRASRLATVEARIAAFENADSKIQDVIYAFDLLPPWQKKLEKTHERLSGLLQQLMDAEETPNA